MVNFTKSLKYFDGKTYDRYSASLLRSDVRVFYTTPPEGESYANTWEIYTDVIVPLNWPKEIEKALTGKKFFLHFEGDQMHIDFDIAINQLTNGEEEDTLDPIWDSHVGPV